MAETVDTARDRTSADVAAGAPEGWFRRVFGELLESKQAVIGLVILTALCLAAVFANWIMPQNPYDLRQVSFMDGMLAPGETGMTGMVHVLGTDAQGRDMLSAMIFGLRTSILVAVTGTVTAVIIGSVVGLTAAFLGGIFETVTMRIVDMQISFPPLLLALVLVASLGSGIDKIIIAIIAVYWAYFARIMHGSALVERRKEYIEAGICLALPRYRLVLRHLLVNCLPPVIVVATIQLANAVQIEATLSFLGLGASVTEPSLGRLISNGFEYMLAGKYWISVFPGIILLILIFSVNMVGDHLRDILNPRLQR